MAIRPDGTSVSQLASTVGMTKQAMGEQVRHLERLGYLSVEVNPADRRARVVRLTDCGQEAVIVGARVVAEFDDWLDEIIGPAEVATLRATLLRIANWRGRP